MLHSDASWLHREDDGTCSPPTSLLVSCSGLISSSSTRPFMELASKTCRERCFHVDIQDVTSRIRHSFGYMKPFYHLFTKMKQE